MIPTADCGARAAAAEGSAPRRITCASPAPTRIRARRNPDGMGGQASLPGMELVLAYRDKVRGDPRGFARRTRQPARGAPRRPTAPAT
jgi:hypothetical protein